MKDLCAVVPVKPFDQAKSRLAAVLGKGQRRALAQTMFVHVLSALARVDAIEDVIVVTADEDAAAIAHAAGVRVLKEAAARGLNTAVEAGLSEAERLSFARALVLPGDLPFLDVGDIARLIAEAAPTGRPQVSLIPAADGDGTNALMLAPPSALAPRFGRGSFLAHLTQALARQVDVRVHHLESFAIDIDTPADLAHLARSPDYAFLQDASSVPERTANGAT